MEDKCYGDPNERINKSQSVHQYEKGHLKNKSAIVKIFDFKTKRHNNL